MIVIALLISLTSVAICWFAFPPMTYSDAVVVEIQPPKRGLAVASFQLKNQGKKSIGYRFTVETKHGEQWPFYPGGTALPHPGPDLALKPSSSTNLFVAVPGSGKWRVSVVYWEAKSRRDQFCAFLRACYLNKLANELSANKAAYRTYGPEFGE